MSWKRISSRDLVLDYRIVLDPKEAGRFLKSLESEVKYFENELARVKVFGKWHQIPRKQASFGDNGLTYTFSGNTVPALPWTDSLLHLKKIVEDASGYEYNFVLVNRYKDGDDYMGEHKDDEKELDKNTPIASLSLGAARDFIFRHKTTKQGGKSVPNVKLILENGSLLLMRPPTNQHWFHALPKRKLCKNVRINLTFRRMV